LVARPLAALAIPFKFVCKTQAGALDDSNNCLSERMTEHWMSDQRGNFS
jgi:hypothetical protein